MRWTSFLWGLAAVAGVPVLLGGYAYAAEALLARLGARARGACRPWLWLAPAFLLLGGLLVYPVLRTLALSLMDASSSRFVGLENYRHLFTDPNLRVVLRNNLGWMLVFPPMAALSGLAIAVLADRAPGEKVLKSAIFMPSAISFAVAGIIWRFMYQFQPATMPQVGTLNAFLHWVKPSFQPRAWLFETSLNNGALMAGVVWLQAGYAMVLFSASLRSIPGSLLEAARLEGASEVQIFFRVVLPLMKSTVVVVLTTYIMAALKIFDFVYVMTSGALGTEVMGDRMYKEMFIFNHFGRASTLAVVMLAAVLPILVMNLRRFGRKAGNP